MHRAALRGAGANLMVGLSALVVATGVLAVASRAYAAYEAVAEVGLPGYIVLRSDPGNPAWSNLGPGDAVHWLVEAALEDGETGSMQLEVDGTGTMVDAAQMEIAVTTCDEPFIPGSDLSLPNAAVPVCPSGPVLVIARQSLADVLADGFGLVPLPDIEAGVPQELLVSLFLSPDAAADEVRGTVAGIGIGLHAEGGEEPAANPPGPDQLGSTGADVAAVTWLALGLLALGVSITVRRRAMDPEAVKA